MTKFMLILFGGLTLGAAALTLTDAGVMEPSIEKPSVRQDSAHAGIRSLGRYRSGK